MFRSFASILLVPDVFDGSRRLDFAGSRQFDFAGSDLLVPDGSI